MSGLYKYTFLIGKNTAYARKMNALSNKIFGEVVQDTPRRSLRTVKMYSNEPLYKQAIMVDYYPRHGDIAKLMLKLRAYGLYRDEHQDFKEDFARLRILRGKVPRPYGSGEKKTRQLIET